DNAADNGKNLTDKAADAAQKAKDSAGGVATAVADKAKDVAGAALLPEDEAHPVNLDVTGLKPGATYHYRLFARNAAGAAQGEDRTFTVPAEARPHAQTGPAGRVTATGATLQGRLNPLGRDTRFYFEYGPDARYGARTPATPGSRMITPRSAYATLSGLKPGTTYHYRLVAVNDRGTGTGADAQGERI
ncbi:MAG TPA: fibronectin type III domain-containing protein, partial [Candidatus Limnocylindria bacterium]|nr:fibronectin type III domain-containing protein [Candidatus Limnocylindria bacterium]